MPNASIHHKSINNAAGNNTTADKKMAHEKPINKVAENEQQRLLGAIWQDDSSDITLNGFDALGINIYRRNLLANAQRALSISFPTVFELLDSDVSENLVKTFLHSSPPVQGDWAQWGDDFSAFVKATEIGQYYPYLADCAALDWHVHGALHGKDQVLDQRSLQLLADSEPERLIIVFNDNVKLLNTDYPLVEIFDAHHHQDEIQRDVALNLAQQALSQPLVAHDVMIFRPEFQPRISRLIASDGRFMQALMQNKSLAESLDLVSDDIHFSFETWLLNAIKHNLIHYLKEI